MITAEQVAAAIAIGIISWSCWTLTSWALRHAYRKHQRQHRDED